MPQKKRPPPRAAPDHTGDPTVLLFTDYKGKPLTWWTGLRLFLYWGPFIAQLIIFGCFTVNISVVVPRWSSIFLNTHTEQGIIRALLLFFLLSIEVNFCLAILRGPGWLATPADTRKGQVDTSRLQYCARCDVYKEARSHHCSVCQRCVCKQDHHCPWINRCVGYANQKNFVLFLWYAALGCLLCVTTTCLCAYYGALFRLRRGITKNEVIQYIAILLAQFVFALGTAIGLLILLKWQVGVICKNKSDIEDWILTKAKRRRENFIYPYAVGKSESWRIVMGNTFFAQLWFTTPDNEMYRSKGHVWPILPECDYYTLYDEQVQQKKEKRARAIKRSVYAATSGRRWGIDHGLWLCRKCPSVCDPYLKVEVGDQVECMYSTDHWTWIEVWEQGVKVRKGWVPRFTVDPEQPELADPAPIRLEQSSATQKDD